MSDSTPLPRFGLAAACLAHAALFSWAASNLPWRSGTSFALLLSCLALLHLTTAATAALGKREWLLLSWRALALVSLIAFCVLSWWMAATAIYVSKLYLRLGSTVAGGIAVAACLSASLTLPLAIWGALRCLPRRARSPKRLGVGALTLIALCVLTLPLASSAARGERVAHANSEVATSLSAVLERHARRPARGEVSNVAAAPPAECAEPVSSAQLTLLVAYVHKKQGSPRSACLQEPSEQALLKSFRRLLRRRARPGSVVVIDLVRSVKQLSPTFPLLDALELRPGLDGVCEGLRCLPAWQLTLRDVFGEHEPIAGMPDASYGFSTRLVRRALGSAAAGEQRDIEGFQRIETDSFSADAAGVHRLLRTRSAAPALSRESVARALENAQRFIIEAQERDGTFRYALDPGSGAEDEATLNLPRQAGTAYALCELGAAGRVRRTVKRAMAAFRQREAKLGELSALVQNGDDYGLGKSALPLLALLRCRGLVGTENDRLIGQLGRLLLHMQRPNGSFYPLLEPKQRVGQGEHEAMYAAGQAVLALVLLEQQLGKLSDTEAAPLPQPRELGAAIDRAMGYYGGPYWPTPQRDFFFFEEGWHCLAARTALSSHRNDAYEQLCLDYVGSRMRFMLRPGETNEPNFVGGYGVSDVFPPRNTPTAGLGEALAAAVAIKRKRSLPVEQDLQVMRELVGFLLRAQWSESGCYACRKPELVVGGFSEHLAAPSIRIDYVQHAMAAIGQGAKQLDML